MILADTSVWIDYLHKGDRVMEALLQASSILMHPFVYGEVAMGSLRDRSAVLHSMRRIPEVLPARDSEVLAFVDREKLFATGIGFIDAHLLAATRLTAAAIWTRDRRLHGVARRIGIATRPE